MWVGLGTFLYSGMWGFQGLGYRDYSLGLGFRACGLEWFNVWGMFQKFWGQFKGFQTDTEGYLAPRRGVYR